MSTAIHHHLRNAVYSVLQLAVFATTLGVSAAIDGSLSDLSARSAGAAKPVGVRLQFEEFHAIKTTKEAQGLFGNDRDEVYIRVIGKNHRGQAIDHRLPSSNDARDDYLEVYDGDVLTSTNLASWSNKNEHIVAVPQIWEGVLPHHGDQAHFQVILMEQDNATIGDTKDILTDIFGACEDIASTSSEGAETIFTEDTGATVTGALGYVKAACKVAKEGVGLLPDNDTHELIGAFVLGVENDNGELRTTFLPANGELLGGAAASTELVGEASGALASTTVIERLGVNRVAMDMRDNEGIGHYRVIVRAESVDPSVVTKGRRVIYNDDVERGTCRGGESVGLRLDDGSRLPISVGETKLIKRTNNRNLDYWCHGSFERERGLFKRDYEEFLVRRTHSKIDFFPLNIEPYSDSVSSSVSPHQIRSLPDLPTISDKIHGERKAANPSTTCFDAVQGRVAWNYRGSKRWADGNVRKLCAGAESTTAPAECFRKTMHGGVNWGGGTRWSWRNALALCNGAPQVNTRIPCFEAQVRSGRHWSDAIARCTSGR